MSTVPAETGVDLYAEQPDLARLLGALRRARGFALYFARCNSPSYRNRLVNALQARLQRPVVPIDLEIGGTASLDARVETALRDAPSDAVAFIYHLESFLPSSDPDRQTETLRQLNWRRGSFARLEHPLVFWLPEYALNILASGAPDFYDWYSGVYEFDLPESARQDIVRETIEKTQDFNSVRGFSFEEKRQWREVLEELAAEASGETRTERQMQLNSLNRLGFLAQEQADYAAAKNYFDRAVKISEATYGTDHPNVATFLNNLGRVLQDLGNLQDAKALFERALHIDEAAFGTDHPDVAIDANNLGGVLQGQGDLQGAKAQFERALNILRHSLGDDHPTTKLVKENLDSVLEDR